MSNQLVATVVKYGTQWIESYKRLSRASDEEKEANGLLPDDPQNAVIGISAIKEYVVFQTVDIQEDQRKTFALSRWGADLAFESIYVENPNGDYFYIEVYDQNNNRIINQYIYRNRTPLEFPSNPLTGDLTIKIKAVKHISFLRLTAVPCKILETFFAEEDYAAMSSRGRGSTDG